MPKHKKILSCKLFSGLAPSLIQSCYSVDFKILKKIFLNFRIERDLFRDEAQELSHQLNSLKQQNCQIEVQLVKEVEQNFERKREAELNCAKEASLRTRSETELKNRENVRKHFF